MYKILGADIPHYNWKSRIALTEPFSSKQLLFSVFMFSSYLQNSEVITFKNKKRNEGFCQDREQAFDALALLR